MACFGTASEALEPSEVALEALPDDDFLLAPVHAASKGAALMPAAPTPIPLSRVRRLRPLVADAEGAGSCDAIDPPGWATCEADRCLTEVTIIQQNQTLKVKSFAGTVSETEPKGAC